MNFDELMKQASQMQDKLKVTQKELAQLEVTGESGAGLVKVVMNGQRDVKKVSIDPSLLNDSKDMLEDLVAMAMNDANHKLEKAIAKNIPSLLGSGLADHGIKF